MLSRPSGQDNFRSKTSELKKFDERHLRIQQGSDAGLVGLRYPVLLITFYLQLQQSNLAYLIKMPNLLSILFCIFKRIAQPCLFLFIFGLFKQTFSN